MEQTVVEIGSIISFIAFISILWTASKLWIAAGSTIASDYFNFDEQ